MPCIETITYLSFLINGPLLSPFQVVIFSSLHLLPCFNSSSFSAKPWVEERLKSKGLRTPQTGKSPSPKEEMGSLRKPEKSVFFVMLKSLLLFSPVLARCLSIVVHPHRQFFLCFFGYFCFVLFGLCFLRTVIFVFCFWIAGCLRCWRSISRTQGGGSGMLSMR